MKSKLISLALAMGAFILAACRINHGLVDSPLPSGPGLTPDESFNIVQGYYLFDAFCEHGPLLFTPAGAREVFGADGYLPDHPPLGRFMLGLAHELTSWLVDGDIPVAFNVPAARLGSCFAFAMTVLLLTEFTRRRYGLPTAIAAAVALMIMPRVVGHARLASLETMTSLAWLATFVPLWAWWTSTKPPTNKQCLIGGALLGVLLITKIQGVLVPPLVVAWAIWKFRQHAIRPLAVWGLTGLLVCFVGWPWLWLDPLGHLGTYLGKASVQTNEHVRPTLYVWYLNYRYTDKLAPWHYPFLITIVTVPLVVLMGFVARLIHRRLDNVEQFVLASALWPLIVFALPGTPVYDGSRLFLVIMQAVAVFSARGAVFVLSSQKRFARVTAWIVVLGLSVWSFSKCLSPFSLETYSLATMNGAGAQKIGMDSSYWVSGLNGDFWKQVPEGSTVYVAPVSHQFQLNDLQQLVPIVSARQIRLKPFLYDPEKQRGLILLNHRLADLPPLLREVPEGADVIAEVKSEGVVIARLIDTTKHTWLKRSSWPEDQR